MTLNNKKFFHLIWNTVVQHILHYLQPLYNHYPPMKISYRNIEVNHQNNTSSNITIKDMYADTTKLTDGITDKIDHLPLIAELIIN